MLQLVFRQGAPADHFPKILKENAGQGTCLPPVQQIPMKGGQMHPPRQESDAWQELTQTKLKTKSPSSQQVLVFCSQGCKGSTWSTTTWKKTYPGWQASSWLGQAGLSFPSLKQNLHWTQSPVAAFFFCFGLIIGRWGGEVVSCEFLNC